MDIDSMPRVLTRVQEDVNKIKKWIGETAMNGGIAGLEVLSDADRIAIANGEHPSQTDDNKPVTRGELRKMLESYETLARGINDQMTGFASTAAEFTRFREDFTAGRLSAPQTAGTVAPAPPASQDPAPGAEPQKSAPVAGQTAIQPVAGAAGGNGQAGSAGRPLDEAAHETQTGPNGRPMIDGGSMQERADLAAAVSGEPNKPPGTPPDAPLGPSPG